MAIYKTFYCQTCNRTVSEMMGSGEHRMQCSSCMEAKDQAAKAAHFAALHSLTLEQRVARLEQAEYERISSPPIDPSSLRY